MHDLWDFLSWWFINMVAGATVLVGQVAHKLARLDLDAPTDPARLEHWHKRKKWLVVTEFSALPAFTTMSVAVVSYLDMPPVAGVIINMVLGFVGFAMVIDGARYVFRARLSIPAEERRNDA